jgi:hypothetical protein
LRRTKGSLAAALFDFVRLAAGVPKGRSDALVETVTLGTGIRLGHAPMVVYAPIQVSAKVMSSGESL